MDASDELHGAELQGTEARHAGPQSSAMPRTGRKRSRVMRRVFASSRFLITLAVLGTFFAAASVLIYGALTVIGIVFHLIGTEEYTPDGAKRLAVDAIEIIDVFLLGTVLYITALGLYQLFLDDTLPMPKWLVIQSLDDLKERLVGVVVVLLAVSFLGAVVTWNGNVNIAALGFAVGLVLFALAYLLTRGGMREHVDEPEQQEPPAIPHGDGESGAAF